MYSISVCICLNVHRKYPEVFILHSYWWLLLTNGEREEWERKERLIFYSIYFNIWIFVTFYYFCNLKKINYFCNLGGKKTKQDKNY